jgi:phosphate transport system permease protein
MATMYPSPPELNTQDTEFNVRVKQRHRSGAIWLIIFQASTLVGVIALLALLYNIANGAFGLIAVEYRVDPDDLAINGVELVDMDKEMLLVVLEENVSAGLFRQLGREMPFDERSRDEIYDIIVERVLRPKVMESYPLIDSLLKRNQIIEEAQRLYPKAEIEFKSWLTSRFLVTPQSSDPVRAGVRTAILGSLSIIAITILIAFPLGVGAAIYLQEYADTEKRINRLIQTNINNLAGVPSIIYGMLGLAVFVRALEPLTSGALLGFLDADTTASGRTIVSAGATLALLILPVIIINAQEAIKAVPPSLREAAYGLGATRWQTVWNHVLPVALPGIMTGTILSVSRAIGETAPLVVVGASTFITFDPSSPFSKFTALPIQIYQWTARPQPEFRNIAAAAIIVLLIMLLSMNAFAILIRNRFSRRDW